MILLDFLRIEGSLDYSLKRERQEGLSTNIPYNIINIVHYWFILRRDFVIYLTFTQERALFAEVMSILQLLLV